MRTGNITLLLKKKKNWGKRKNKHKPHTNLPLEHRSDITRQASVKFTVFSRVVFVQSCR